MVEFLCYPTKTLQDRHELYHNREVYQTAAKSFEKPPINLRFNTTKLAMFIKQEMTSLSVYFFTYKQLPLGQDITSLQKS